MFSDRQGCEPATGLRSKGKETRSGRCGFRDRQALGQCATLDCAPAFAPRLHFLMRFSFLKLLRAQLNIALESRYPLTSSICAILGLSDACFLRTTLRDLLIAAYVYASTHPCNMSKLTTTRMHAWIEPYLSSMYPDNGSNDLRRSCTTCDRIWKMALRCSTQLLRYMCLTVLV